jgi:hypothetical protein
LTLFTDAHGWIATARDLAHIDCVWRQWSPGFSLDPV